MSSAAGGRITAGVGANLIGQHAQDRNQEATVYTGNLDPQVTEELIWELFTQGGPVVNVYLPKDRVTNNHQGYGFVEFRSEEDADYAIKILNMIKMYGKPIRVNKASSDRKTNDVGANLFIGNLDVDVDEKLLYDTFSAFGVIINTPKLMRDPETGNSRGFGFVSYDCFEASDAAIEAMNGQYLCNRAISVSYAFKKDTKGERHGTPAERLLAAQQQARQAQQSRPNTLFASGPKQQGQSHGPPPVPAPAPPTSGTAPLPVSGLAPPPPLQYMPAPQSMPPPQMQQPPPQYMPPPPQYNYGHPPGAPQYGQMSQNMPPPPQQMQQFAGPPPGYPSNMPPPPGYPGQGPPPGYMQAPPGMPQGMPPPPGYMQPPPGYPPQGMPPPPGYPQNMPPPPGYPGGPPMQQQMGMPPPPQQYMQQR